MFGHGIGKVVEFLLEEADLLVRLLEGGSLIPLLGDLVVKLVVKDIDLLCRLVDLKFHVNGDALSLDLLLVHLLGNLHDLLLLLPDDVHRLDVEQVLPGLEVESLAVHFCAVEWSRTKRSRSGRSRGRRPPR